MTFHELQPAGFKQRRTSRHDQTVLLGTGILIDISDIFFLSPDDPRPEKWWSPLTSSQVHGAVETVRLRKPNVRPVDTTIYLVCNPKKAGSDMASRNVSEAFRRGKGLLPLPNLCEARV